MRINITFGFLYVLLITSCIEKTMHETEFNKALENAVFANEAFVKSNHYLKAWLELRDSASGLIPRNTKDQFWNPQDAAADNYPFMVLTSFFTNSSVFNNEMLDMLEQEIKLTSRIGHCPDVYSFEKQDFLNVRPDTGNIIFGSSEYLKDGLMPLMEWLGPSPWSNRMINIINDLYNLCEGPVTKIQGQYLGGVPELEINGELLQVLSRLYWMTGNEKFLRWAIEIGDYYLLNKENRIENYEYLRLRDHGCEIISGLSELYIALSYVDKEKMDQYSPSLFSLYKTILDKGRNEHGMFYNAINPKTGEVIDSGIADTYGYTLNGIYTLYMVSDNEEFRKPVIKALINLQKFYTDQNWEGNYSADGYADAIESALNLYNRESVEHVDSWLDTEIVKMWNIQKENGIVEGWHGDGNFARTSIMYALWKTQGTYISNWDKRVSFGAHNTDDKLFILVKSDVNWDGKLFFDEQRHKTHLNLPYDYPRINQFPEWFTIKVNKQYHVKINDNVGIYDGKELIKGLEMNIDAGETIKIIIYEPNM